MSGFGFGSVWVWVLSKNRSLVWFGSKLFVLGLVRFGLHFENLVRFCSQNSELVSTLILNLFHNKISQKMSEMIDVVVDEDRINVYNVCRHQLGGIWSDVPQSQLIIKRFS